MPTLCNSLAGAVNTFLNVFSDVDSGDHGSENQDRGALYCDCTSVARSQRDPCQLLMVPLSPQTGHHHTMASVSGSISVPIAPAQSFRLGRRRHLTGLLLGSSQGSVVASTTIFVRYSASFLAGPDFGPIAPSSVRKCVRSVTQVFPIQPFPFHNERFDP